MAFSTGGGDGIKAEINVTPLVDVMLVLLIIFMITTPLLSHKIKITLPDKTMTVPEDKLPPPITLAVQATGALYWNDEPINKDGLLRQLRIEARREPQPLLEIRADKTTQYRLLQEVMGVSKDAGMKKIGFITTPEK